MKKKIIAICIVCCFFASTLYAQTISLEQRSVTVRITGASIIKKLDLLIEQLDHGIISDMGDLETILFDLQGIDNDVRAISDDLQSMSLDNSTTCSMIRWIPLTWGAVGLLSTTSFLTAIVRLVILQSTPGVSPARHERKLTQQYLKVVRKLIVSSVIIPVSVINVILASRQYRECLHTDF